MSVGQLCCLAITGAHRWAERYDRELKNVFAVRVEVARTSFGATAANSHVTVTVANAGPGIHEARLARIFEQFMR